MSAPHHTEARTLRFGVFEVDFGVRELRKRGVRIKFQDQPFRVLEALLEKPGEIVTREELKDRLWAHDEFVEFDKSVNTAVQKIRQALGDSVESPRFLETVPRIGYRFVASVTDRDGSVAPEPAPEANPETYERTFARLSWRNAFWALAGSLALFVLWSLRAPDAPIPRPQVRRFTIDPTHTGPGVYSRPIMWRWEDRAAAAISPDGSRIAYFSDEIPPRLWLHDLSSGESKHVAGAVADEIRNRYSTPTVAWSPRGDALAFRTGGSLAKVGLLDGGVTTLHLADNPATAHTGAAWSLDGERIFFSGATIGGLRLFAMPAAGGDALPLAVADGWNPTAVSGEGGVLVYQRLGGLEVLRIASGQTSILEENGVNPSWSPTGHILFDREGGIWALPFSSDRLEPEGAPFLVEPGFSNAGVSNDGALLAVTSRVQGQRLRLTIRNRHGRLIRKLGPPLFGDRFRARHPTVSPDAKRVAVSGSLQRGAPNDIWVFDLDGGQPLRLTSDANVEDNPVWTPDGRRILFRKNAVSAHPNERPGDADFYIVDAAGAGPVEPVLENAIRLAEADFSPSGRVLIFQQRELEARQSDIYYLPAQEPGAEAQPVPWLNSAFNEVHPQFSPSGKHVAYASGETGLTQIHVRPFPEGWPVWQVSLEGGNSPRWSPDGRELYWHGDSEGWPLTAADVDFGRSNPFGQPTPLFPTGGFGGTYYYDVMPNGQFILLEPDEEDDAESAPPIYFRVIQNWYEQFRRGTDAE